MAYEALSTTELQTLQTNAQTALNALLTGKAQSYSVNGRTVTRTSVKELRELLREVSAEISRRENDIDELGTAVVEFLDP